MIRTRAQVGHNSGITRKSLADEIDTYDQSIADLNGGKKDCFDAYRDQLIAAGVAKENVRKEIEAVKAAIRRRRLVTKDAGAVEEKDALVDEIFAEISARPRAPRTRVENIEEFGANEDEGSPLEQRAVVSGGVHVPGDSVRADGAIHHNSDDRGQDTVLAGGPESTAGRIAVTDSDDGLDIPEFLRRPAR